MWRVPKGGILVLLFQRVITEIIELAKQWEGVAEKERRREREQRLQRDAGRDLKIKLLLPCSCSLFMFLVGFSSCSSCLPDLFETVRLKHSSQALFMSNRDFSGH